MGKAIFRGVPRRKLVRKIENKTNAMSSYQERIEFQEADGKLVLNITREVKKALKTGRLIWQLGRYW